MTLAEPIIADNITTTTIPLKGIEKLLSGSKTACCIIAHVVAVRISDAQALVAVATPAWRAVVLRHPRIRGRISKTNPAEVVISTTISNEEAAAQVLVSTAVSPTEWQDIIQRRCAEVLPASRTEDFPFSLHLLLPSTDDDQQKVRIIVYSDHYASDVVHDFLSAAVTPETHAPMKSLPLLPPGLDLYFRKTMSSGFSLPVWVIYKLFTLKSKEKCVFPLPTLTVSSSTDKRFVGNAQFATGTRESLAANLAACKANGTTLNAAFLAAMAAAFSRVPGAVVPPKRAGAASRVKYSVDYDMNIRNRVVPPVGNDHVGAYIAMTGVQQYASGLPLDIPFWTHAREVKKTTDKGFASYETGIRLRLFDSYLAKEPENLPDTPGANIIGDMNFSNMGKYPFQTTHTFVSGAGSIEVESVHYYNSLAGIGPAAIIFCSSVRATSYVMNTRVDAAASQRFFEDVVKLFEAVGTVAENETIGEFAARVLGE
ncbi:hypothetical protein BDZ88DRAFT_407440 [Geranomyces variabilis]|nr:hypothetical protein BDZ88DRAFT_407440 [Geranomyces variabilis]KAJ3142450.1 hypothetical protein HDU90_004724 [Geranomyces variabilis]